MTQKRVVPIDGSTVSHHAIITLAIRLSCSAVASSSHCQALLRRAASSGASDAPRDRAWRIHVLNDGRCRATSPLLGERRADHQLDLMEEHEGQNGRAHGV